MSEDKTAHRHKVMAYWALALVVVVFLLSMPFWATDEKDAKATLEAFGFTPLQVGGFDSFGCGIDLYATKFTARNAAGKTIKGNVCRTPGMTKSTIEIDNAE